MIGQPEKRSDLYGIKMTGLDLHPRAYWFAFCAVSLNLSFGFGFKPGSLIGLIMYDQYDRD